MELWIEVKLLERPPMMILGNRGQASTGFTDRYTGLYRKAFQQRIQVIGSPMSVYHGDHFDGQLSDLEAALPVSGDGDGVRELPGGLYANTAHQGPYGTLPVTYTLLGMWAAQNGYRICGAPYEVYVRGGNDKILDPAQYLTEIYLPVEEDTPPPDLDL